MCQGTKKKHQPKMRRNYQQLQARDFSGAWLNTSTNNLLLLSPFKNKEAVRGNKKCHMKLLFPSLWKQQFFIFSSCSYNPCHVPSLLAEGAEWQRVLHSCHVGSGSSTAPRQTGCRKIPLKNIYIKYLQICFFVTGPPGTEKHPPLDS